MAWAAYNNAPPETGTTELDLDGYAGALGWKARLSTLENHGVSPESAVRFVLCRVLDELEATTWGEAAKLEAPELEKMHALFAAVERCWHLVSPPSDVGPYFGVVASIRDEYDREFSEAKERFFGHETDATEPLDRLEGAVAACDKIMAALSQKGGHPAFSPTLTPGQKGSLLLAGIVGVASLISGTRLPTDLSKTGPGPTLGEVLGGLFKKKKGDTEPAPEPPAGVDSTEPPPPDDAGPWAPRDNEAAALVPLNAGAGIWALREDADEALRRFRVAYPNLDPGVWGDDVRLTGLLTIVQTDRERRHIAPMDRPVGGPCGARTTGGWASISGPCELEKGHDGEHCSGAIFWLDAPDKPVVVRQGQPDPAIVAFHPSVNQPQAQSIPPPSPEKPSEATMQAMAWLVSKGLGRPVQYLGTDPDGTMRLTGVRMDKGPEGIPHRPWAQPGPRSATTSYATDEEAECSWWLWQVALTIPLSLVDLVPTSSVPDSLEGRLSRQKDGKWLAAIGYYDRDGRGTAAKGDFVAILAGPLSGSASVLDATLSLLVTLDYPHLPKATRETTRRALFTLQTMFGRADTSEG